MEPDTSLDRLGLQHPDDLHDEHVQLALQQLDALLPGFRRSAHFTRLSEVQRESADAILRRLAGELAIVRGELPTRWTCDRLMLACSNPFPGWPDEAGGYPRGIAPVLVAFLLFLDDAGLHANGLVECMGLYETAIAIDDANPAQPMVSMRRPRRARKHRAHEVVNLDVGPLPTHPCTYRRLFEVLEDQATLDDPPGARSALERLLRAGLPRREALRRMGDALQATGYDTEVENPSFDERAYRALLSDLT